MVKRERAFHKHLVHILKPAQPDSSSLFGYRHVKLIVGHPARASKVITNEVTAGEDKYLPYLRVQSGCAVLVA